MTASVEELLRETLERLRRQEERTAALEAALSAAPPPAPAGDTVVAPWPKSKPAPRAPLPDCPAPTAVSPLAVLASLDVAVWSVSPDGQFVFFAAGAVERLYRKTAHELQDGRGLWLDAFPPDDRDRLRDALARLPEADAFRLEHRVEAASDRRAVTRGKLVRDRDGRPLRVDGSTADVTPHSPACDAGEADRAELRARLAEAEQRAREAEAVLRGAVNLATAGRVAAGVAHDFQNLLSVIVGNAELLRESLPEDDPHRETAETIARTAQTVAGASRKVLAVGRPGTRQAVPLDVGAALNTLAPILRRLTGQPVSLAFDLAPELPPIHTDATEFDRVVLNLVLNARDACAAGGSVTVRAAAAEIGPGRRGWPANRAPGHYVALTVADTGCGMSPEVRKRMFDLFFTTKGDRGTGLGLAMVRDAVAAADGHVEVESEVGWGTQVRVYWPAL